MVVVGCCVEGTVDALSDLCCEVVFHPSYLAPLEGQFALQVHGGSTEKLHCTAKVTLYSVALQAGNGAGNAQCHQSRAVMIVGTSAFSEPAVFGTAKTGIGRCALHPSQGQVQNLGWGICHWGWGWRSPVWSMNR